MIFEALFSEYIKENYYQQFIKNKLDSQIISETLLKNMKTVEDLFNTSIFNIREKYVVINCSIQYTNDDYCRKLSDIIAKSVDYEYNDTTDIWGESCVQLLEYVIENFRFYKWSAEDDPMQKYTDGSWKMLCLIEAIIPALNIDDRYKVFCILRRWLKRAGIKRKPVQKKKKK